MSKDKIICNFSKSSLASIIFTVFVTSLIILGANTYSAAAEDVQNGFGIELEEELTFQISPQISPSPVNCAVDSNVVAWVTNNGATADSHTIIGDDIEAALGVTVRNLFVDGPIPECVDTLVVTEISFGCKGADLAPDVDATIIDWVDNNGGQLLILEDHSSCGGGAADLTAHFGATRLGNTLIGCGIPGENYDTTEFDASHPTMAGVDNWNMQCGTTFATDGTLETVVTDSDDNNPAMLAGPVNSGCVVITGEANWMEDGSNTININDSRLVANNIFSYLNECSVPVDEPIMLGSDSFNNIFEIDLTTGQATLLGVIIPNGYDVPYSTDIECTPDDPNPQCYAQATNGGFMIQQFDDQTIASIGTSIMTNISAVPHSYQGLEYANGQLYGTSMTQGCGPSSLSILNPNTGNGQLIGLTGVSAISGLAYDESSGTMYGVGGCGQNGPSDFYTINLQTGAATIVGSTGIANFGGLQFGPDGVLYAGGNNFEGGNLYTINPSTGAATIVGPTGFNGVTGLTLVVSEAQELPPVTEMSCTLPQLTGDTEIIIDGEDISFMLDGTCDVTRGDNTEEGLEVKVTVDKNAPGFVVPESTEVLLNEWTAESFGGASWNVSNDGLTVLQTVNGNPTFFYAPFNSINTQFTGKISVANDGDDDFIGFVLGFQPGDTTDLNAEYLLIDWKKGNQNAFGAFAPAGLAVSKINGVPNDTEFWGHQGQVTELARGINLGSTGWQYNTDYEFSFVFTENNLKVFVNGVLELDINGNFTDGRYGFYNFSQSQVTYSGFNVAPVFDETGTVTIDFLDGSGSITINEEGTLSANADGPTYTINGISTGAQGTGDYTSLPQCGSQSFIAIDNNDSASGNASLNQCPVPESEPKKSGGGDNQWDTRPTFGISHEDRGTQVVENGFRFNSEEFMLTDNHHTDFAEQAVEVGTTNSFSATVYADKRLKIQEFLFGIPNVGESHLAELGIEVWYDFDGNIEDVKVVQKSEVIDADTISVSHEKTKCLSTDSQPLCDTTTVSMTFLEPLADKVMAIKAIDFKNRDQRTYLNDGFDVFGNSLNPMLSKMIPSNMRDQGLLKVTQIAKYSPYWTSEDGRTFEMNSFGSFKEVNQTFERFTDTGDARTRMHSGFGGIIQYEQNRAEQLYDASQYVSQLPESFTYIYPESGERISNELLQEMLLQAEIAKTVLEQMDKQNRHY